MHFQIDNQGNIFGKSENLSDDITRTILAKILKKHSNLLEFFEWIEYGGLFYYKTSNYEYFFEITKNSDTIKFNILDDYPSPLDTKIHQIHTIIREIQSDFTKFEIRKYSHDLANQLTIILMNLGFLNDEISVGEITTSDNATMDQVLSSSLETSLKIKKMIDDTRNKYEWEINETKMMNFRDILVQSLEIQNYSYVDSFILQASYSKDNHKNLNVNLLKIMYLIIESILESSKDGNIIEVTLRNNDNLYTLSIRYNSRISDNNFSEKMMNRIDFIKKYLSLFEGNLKTSDDVDIIEINFPLS